MTHSNSPVSEKARYLITRLGPTLVAAGIGFRNRKVISEVSENLDEAFSDEQKRRVEILHEVWTKVSRSEGDDLARAWFIGANPWLNDESAISAIREDRFEQVKIAAQAMINDTPNF